MSDRRRLAWASPLPPADSRVAEYSLDLLPLLAGSFELTVAGETDRCTADLGGLPWMPVDRLGGRHGVRVYHLGNDSRHHRAIYTAATSRPGIAVLHEILLHDLVRDIAMADPVSTRGRARYLEVLRSAYGPTGLSLGRRLLALGEKCDAWAMPLFEPVVDASLGVIVHNEWARRRILASRPDAAVEVVPHPFGPPLSPAPQEPAAARASLGLPADGFLVGSYLSPSRPERADEIARIGLELVRRRPGSRLFLASRAELGPHVVESFAALRDEGALLTLDRLPMPRFVTALAACDVGLSMRHPNHGETSGVLLHLLALGRPLVVSDDGPTRDLPDEICRKVPVDPREDETMLAALLALHDDPDLRADLGHNAAEWANGAHAPERTVAGYVRAVDRIRERPSRKPRTDRPPIARPADGDLGTALLGRLAAGLVAVGAERDEDVRTDVLEQIRLLGLE